MTINTATRLANARIKVKSNPCYSIEIIDTPTVSRPSFNDSFMDQVGCTKRRITRSRLTEEKLWGRKDSYDRREPQLNDINRQYESLKNQLTLILQRLNKSQVGEMKEVDVKKPVSSFPFSNPQHSGSAIQTSQHLPDALPDKRASIGKQHEPSEEFSLFRPPELKQTTTRVALLDRRSSTTSQSLPAIYLAEATPNSLPDRRASIKEQHEFLEEISLCRPHQLRQTGPLVEHLKLTTNSNETAPIVRPLKEADWSEFGKSIDEVENSDQSNGTQKTGELTGQIHFLTLLGFIGGGIRKEKIRTRTGHDRYTERPLNWVLFARTNRRTIVGEGEDLVLTFHEFDPVTAAYACRLKEQNPYRVLLSRFLGHTSPFFSLVRRILDSNENRRLTLKPSHANFVGRIDMPILPWLQYFIDYFKYRHYDPGICPYILTIQCDFFKQVVFATTSSEPSNSPNYQLSRITTDIVSSKPWGSRFAMTLVGGLESRVGGKIPVAGI